MNLKITYLYEKIDVNLKSPLFDERRRKSTKKKRKKFSREN
jgi:hypothetical protein